MDTQRLKNVRPSVRLIALQFSFSNPDFVPGSVRQLGRESTQEQRIRENLSTGEVAIEPHQETDLIPFLGEVEQVGYRLVDAIHQARDDQHDPRRAFQMVRFVFVRNDPVRPSKFDNIRAAICSGLRVLCEQALWRCRVYLNPLLVEGRRVGDEHAVSINLDARKPLFSGGKRIAVWRRDENRQKVGEAPVPIQAVYELRFRDNAIELVPATAP